MSLRAAEHGVNLSLFTEDGLASIAMTWKEMISNQEEQL
jgi:hypothetical protein